MNKLKPAATLIILLIAASSFYPGNHAAGLAKYGDTSLHANLQLPAGFTAIAIVTGLESARHLVVTKQGGIYVKLSRLKDGKGIYYLKDTNGDGIIDSQTGFGDYPGTGIFIKNGYLYASSNDDVYRYRMNDKGEVINPNAPEKIITGLVNHNRDNSKSIAIDNADNIYVNIGSYSNSCLIDEKSRVAPSPCPLLDSVAGIWKFKTNKLNQGYKQAVHYATGFKNIVGLDWNSTTNSLFVMQHGRDLLHDLYPQYYTVEQNNIQPAETMYELHQGTDGGWPYVYYDQKQHKKILSPEYGGDDFPAHLAPNALLFYTGNMFPGKYKNGAFIAFHGKSQELQKGYLVAFVPFKKNQPSGKWEIFADNFATTGNVHKPCGLAQGPDGSIYVADDVKGTIYRIRYKR